MIKCAIHRAFLSYVKAVPKMAQKSRHHKILGPTYFLGLALMVTSFFKKKIYLETNTHARERK